MSIKYDQSSFEEYAAELAGSSRDRAMRPAIEQMVRQFFRALEDDDMGVDDCLEFFGYEPIVICGLKGPGLIRDGREEVDEWIRHEARGSPRFVPKIIVVDRARVTCHLLIFRFNINGIVVDTFQEVQKIAIFDLDNKNRIQRLEYRDVAGTVKDHKGGRPVFDTLVKEAEENASAVDYLS